MLSGWLLAALFFFWRMFRNAKSDLKFGWGRVVLVMPVPGKRGSETPIRLAAFLK
jgi:hypothetical protein